MGFLNLNLELPHDHSALFSGMLIKCVVHLELIATVDAIIFFPATSKKDDEHNMQDAQVALNQLEFWHGQLCIATGFSRESSKSEAISFKKNISRECTRVFPLNSCFPWLAACWSRTISQSNSILTMHKGICYGKLVKLASVVGFNLAEISFVPGFKGKNKPNLVRQEVSSIASVLRILFRLYVDDSREAHLPQIQSSLIA